MNSDLRTSPFQSTALPKVIVTISLCGVSWLSLLLSSYAQETAGDLTVPVSDLAERSPVANPQMVMAPVADVQPTLPGGKLPQYQLTHRHLAVETDELIADAKVRFLLALPKELLLIDASITIDGRPFRREREDRVQAALQAALQPPEVIEQPIKAERPEQPVDENELSSKDQIQAEEAIEAEENTDRPSMPAFQTAPSVTEKLRRYIASIGREPSLKEVRSFFIHRLDGPTLLLLNDNFQAFRTDQAPIFHILDRDRDGAISAEEIEQAMQSFLDCDLNRNEVVDYLEISEAANDPRLKTDSPIGLTPLLHSLPTDRTAAEIYAELSRTYASTGGEGAKLPLRFDANSNGQWEPEELKQLHSMPADITLKVDFDSADSEKSKLTIPKRTISELSTQQMTCFVLNNSVVLSREDCDIWFSASQSTSSDQVSIGAVRDGYPMLPVIDPDDDGRFTLRELRSLSASLKSFDRNDDGQILKEELRPTIRIAFGRGPHVHQMLAGIRKVPRADSTATTAPEWFVRMDRNKDRDLTRKEFPGTDAQFAQLDSDGDELVSAAEALEFDRKSKSDQPTQESNDEPTQLEDK